MFFVKSESGTGKEANQRTLRYLFPSRKERVNQSNIFFSFPLSGLSLSNNIDVLRDKLHAIISKTRVVSEELSSEIQSKCFYRILHNPQ